MIKNIKKCIFQTYSIPIALFFFVLLILIYSVIKSGLLYQYDGDELFHAQLIYLLSKGYKPYESIFMIHTPLFHWFLTPIYKIIGFSFTALFISRLMMLLLLMIRASVSYLFIRKIFGKKTALIFLPLFFLDPFMVFSAMQIRPDNLMMTVFMIGLLLLYEALERKSNRWFFVCGLVFGLSILINMKILVSLGVVVILLIIYSLSKRNIKNPAYFIGGFVIPWILFFIWSFSRNILFQMIEHIFIYSQAVNTAILAPNKVEFFYRPNNNYFYGFSGRPLTWIYVWILPVLAVLGISMTLLRYKMIQNKWNPVSLIKIILIFTFFSQWIWLFSIHTVFMQYFVTVGWLMAVFGAYTISCLISAKNIIYRHAAAWVFLILYVIFPLQSIRANLARAAIDSRHQAIRFSQLWSWIGENEATFPNFLFRPSVYPVTYGAFIGDIPNAILRKFAPINTVIEKNKVRVLLLDSWTMTFLDGETRKYIDENYRWDKDKEMYVRY